MRAAIDETERRRAKQLAFNQEHGIDPKPLQKKISDVTDMLAREDIDTEQLLATGYRQPDKKPSVAARTAARDAAAARAALEVIAGAREQATIRNAGADHTGTVRANGGDTTRGTAKVGAKGEEIVDLEALLRELSTQMHQAASEMRFELAARLRDEIVDLKREIRRGKPLGG